WELIGKVAAKASPEEARILNNIDEWPQILKTHGIMPASMELDDVGLNKDHAKRPIHKKMSLLGAKNTNTLMIGSSPI
ncbi:MAG: hypothetical protein NZ656_00280, partial [Nitrospinaceae bacterium]|nr:hypothetical protein [Nitrospinaceae bacterium]